MHIGNHVGYELHFCDFRGKYMGYFSDVSYNQVDDSIHLILPCDVAVQYGVSPVIDRKIQTYVHDGEQDSPLHLHYALLM